MNPFHDLLPIKDILLCALICCTRMLAFCSISVFFSSQYLTGTGRRALIVALSLILVPLFLPSSLEYVKADVLCCLGYILKESILGIVLGLLSNFIFYVAQGVGFLIDTQRGASMASMFDPLSNSQTSPLGDFLMKFTLILALLSGAFLKILEMVYVSYLTFPIFSPFPPLENWLPNFFLTAFGDGLFSMLALLGGPVLFILFLSEFGLGMVTRFAPQLNVFFLAMPIKSALAMFFFILYLAHLGEYFLNNFELHNLAQRFLNALQH
ncbi:MAG: type III secretion system export apparatus subunit SctT [Puniceicoccales bacterium]|jgi:type III secretion protein T|nr:type III secretion system export apparatus subunit SctT [Puniceicoccales bacterium]